MGRVKQLGEKTELSTTERGGTACLFATSKGRLNRSYIGFFRTDIPSSQYRYSRFGRSGFRFVSPKQTKPLSMPPQKRFWLDDEQGLFPGPNQPCQKHQEDPICLGACRSFEDDQLLAQERVFCLKFGLASGKVMYRSQHERSRRRFCPVSEVLLKQLKTHSRQSLYRVENMIHGVSFPLVKLSR